MKIFARLQAASRRLTNVFRSTVSYLDAGRWCCSFALLALGFSFSCLSSAAQISPGPLSKPHESLNGATQCTACHKLGTRATYKCLDCHTEIAERMAKSRGLHSTYAMKAGSSQECARCHSEHNGENFQLIKWSPKTFDHKTAGFALEEKHAVLECRHCHVQEKIPQSHRSSIRVKNLNRTYLGLSSQCVSCHDDYHRGRLGTDCAQCHSAGGWKDVSQFNHSKTRFPLTGLHARITCEKCHPPGPDGKARFVGIPFSKCSDCHADPHRSSFAAQRCESCHSTAGWTKISLQKLNRWFDHSKTRYPLLGKHASVNCGKCHASGDFKKLIAFDRCSSCHTPDPHKGQFTTRKDKGECATCHTVAGFTPSTFGVKEHAGTVYPLKGAHANVACAGCHIPRGVDTRFTIPFARCTDCHEDAHDRQFAAVPIANRCEDCHTVDTFKPSTFTLIRHKQTRFVLTGGHVAVPCLECHKPVRADQPGSALFRFKDRTCTRCHQDPHRGQFQLRMKAVTASGTPAGCETCHSTAGWKDLSRFDHDKSDFPLVGSHRAVACADCHKPPNLEVSLANVKFDSAPSACAECHSDIHAGQFKQNGELLPCSSCHNTNKWKQTVFDHEKRTRFSLQGAHQNVRCAGCHTLKRVVEGKEIVFYKPTPMECQACHDATIPQSSPSW